MSFIAETRQTLDEVEQKIFRVHPEAVTVSDAASLRACVLSLIESQRTLLRMLELPDRQGVIDV